MSEHTAEVDAAEIAMQAIERYDREREEERRVRSTEFWGHPGAHVSEAFPTRAGRVAATAAALTDAGIIDPGPTPGRDRADDVADDRQQPWHPASRGWAG